jgi:hypothetical protein
MIRYLFLFSGIVTFLFSCSNGKSQDSDSLAQVEIVQNFEVGKKYQYELQRGNADSRHPETKIQKAITDIELTVLKKDKLTECSWKYGRTRTEGIDLNAIDEYNRAMINIYEGIEEKFLLDEKGRIQEITNYEECKNFIENSLKYICDNLGSKATPEQIEQVKESFKTSYANPEILVETYCPDLTVFFSENGEVYRRDSVYVSKGEIGNPFGGKNFPTDVSKKFEKVKGEISEINIQQVIPPSELKSIMKETFIEFSKLASKPFNENDIPNMSMKSTMTFEFNYKTREMEKVFSERVNETSGVTQRQTMLILKKK